MLMGRGTAIGQREYEHQMSRSVAMCGAEAEYIFCLGFAAQRDDLACEEDGKLTQGAIEVKRDLLALVKAQR
jgi:hypothetical protein